MGKIRLYVPQLLKINQNLDLSEDQSHYLCNVMKVKVGDVVSCFDGVSGEYECQVSNISKKHTVLFIVKQNKILQIVPDIWLLFAPVKKDNTDFIVQKSVELGVRKIIPVITKYTITERIKKERFIANAIEAAEQCRRTDVVDIEDAIKFETLLNNWDNSRTLYYMDETHKGLSVAETFVNAPAPCAILVGPEGGFSEQELKRLRQEKFAHGVNLGNRILRAETAVVSALSCWQALNGDWR